MERDARSKAEPNKTIAGRPRVRALLLALLAGVLSGGVYGAEPATDLKNQIRMLAEQHHFRVVGLHRVTEEPAKEVDGDMGQQLRELLRSYNYLAIHDDSGQINQILISSRKRLAAEVVPGYYRIRTTRRGVHHLVDAVLVGPNGTRQTASLIVDTGATDVVLPESMTTQLGFAQTQLRDGWSQTANGRVRIKRGVIRSLRVGQAEAQDVRVNFVADKALGGVKLLGMSFLGRFQVTLDDENDHLLLLNK